MPSNFVVRNCRIAIAVVLVAAAAVAGSSAQAAVPSGFSDVTTISGLTNPTNVQFAPDGWIFVATKSGRIYGYSSLTDAGSLVADLSTEVDDYWDRGLLGLAISPTFTTDHSIWVLYSFDGAIGGTAPAWNDACPTPPGATTDGCVISGRLSKLSLTTNTSGRYVLAPGGENVLLNDWCQQFPSHSQGALRFGADGYLYASSGDGASFNSEDFGQLGHTYAADPYNPCGDPPGGVGTQLASPTAEGGALRAQSATRPAGQPVSLDGSIIRVDPNTGAAAPGNPFAASTDPNKQRIVAYGMRNPFRFVVRPQNNELWVGDVGWNTWEEINRIPDGSDATAENFGWPCYEGVPASSYQNYGLNQCTSLYGTAGAVTAPYYAYNHSASVVSGDGCATGGSSITGVAFYPGGNYPAQYNGALFFADHTRNCMWSMNAGANGLPSTSSITPFTPAANPVDIEAGPDWANHDLFYVDMDGGKIHRLVYASSAGNQPPVARVTASPTSGPVGVNVTLDASTSTDPEGGPLTYAWDFGDGSATATGPTVSHAYNAPGTFTATVTATDAGGLTSSATAKVSVGMSTSMTVRVTDRTTLAQKETYAVGDNINFSGSATDTNGRPLPASALNWNLTINHCASATNCHTHDVETRLGVASGTFSAPDHSYPCFITVTLTATDAVTGQVATQQQRVDPQTVNVNFKSNPAGLTLGVDSTTATAPFAVTMVARHQATLAAPSPQNYRSWVYNWQSWSDKAAQNHTITATSSTPTYTAFYRKK